MVTIRVKAVLRSSGELDFDLPDDLPNENFELILNVARDDSPHSADYVDTLRREEQERNARWTLS